MKKGDKIQMRQDIPAGKGLMHGFTSLDKAKGAMITIRNHYNLPASAKFSVGNDVMNAGKYSVLAVDDTYAIIEAIVNWIVDNEAGITYSDTGSSAIIDVNAEDQQGWVVISSAAPVFQSGVEHMSDDQLRASIEALRSNRIARPAKPAKAKKVKTPREPAMTAKDKALSGMLASLTPEAKLALQRKLGLID